MCDSRFGRMSGIFVAGRRGLAGALIALLAVGFGAANGFASLSVANLSPTNVFAASYSDGVFKFSAFLNGNLIDTNGAPTRVWVFWDTTNRGSNKIWANGYDFGGDYQSVGGLTYHATNLVWNQTYYYTYYASNTAGDAWGTPSTQFVASASAFEINLATNTGLDRGDWFLYSASDNLLLYRPGSTRNTTNATLLYMSPNLNGPFYKGGKFDPVTGDLWFNVGRNPDPTKSWNGHTGYEVHRLRLGETNSTTEIPDLSTIIPSEQGFGDVAAYNGVLYAAGANGPVYKFWNDGTNWHGTTGAWVGYYRGAGLRCVAGGKFLVTAPQGNGDRHVYVVRASDMSIAGTWAGVKPDTNNPSTTYGNPVCWPVEIAVDNFSGPDANGLTRFMVLNDDIVSTNDTSMFYRIVELAVNASGAIVNPYAGVGNVPGNTNAMVGVTYSQSVGYVDTMAFNGAGNLIVMDRGASQQVKLFTQAQLNQHSTSVTNGSGTVITLPQPSWWAVNHFDINNPLLVRGTSMIFK